MVTQVTGLAHSDFAKVAESVCKGNEVQIVREPKQDRNEGKAYKAFCKETHIGYLPLISTLRGYYRKAKNDDCRNRINQWGIATRAVREWLEGREKYNNETEWSVRVQTLLYQHPNGKWTEEEVGNPKQISVNFEEVEG